MKRKEKSLELEEKKRFLSVGIEMTIKKAIHLILNFKNMKRFKRQKRRRYFSFIGKATINSDILSINHQGL